MDGFKKSIISGDKMSEFDKHWDTHCISSNCEEDEAKIHFEAGQKSKQAEIDELQARVDEALKQLDLTYPESWGYCVDEAINILKGNKDEN